jgi:hypothetical protein
MSGGTTVGALHDYDEVMDGSMKFAGRDNQVRPSPPTAQPMAPHTTAQQPRGRAAA